jgi:hypothetical protein
MVLAWVTGPRTNRVVDAAGRAEVSLNIGAHCASTLEIQIMNRKQLALLLLLVLLAGAAVYMFKDSFGAEGIQIAYSVRPAPPARQVQQTRRDAPSGKPGYNVTFNFNRKLALTAVKVFPLEEVLTNKYPHAIWSLVSESNSPPTRSIVYGGRIRGLNPAVKGAVADPLEPGGSYRLVVETAEQKAERDFQIPR